MGEILYAFGLAHCGEMHRSRGVQGLLGLLAIFMGTKDGMDRMAMEWMLGSLDGWRWSF